MVLSGKVVIKIPRFWIAVVWFDFILRLLKSANRRNPTYAKENGRPGFDSKVGVANAFDHRFDFMRNSRDVKGK